jgi:hypothetical protein
VRVSARFSMGSTSLAIRLTVSASQGISRLLWNQTVHCRVCRSPPLNRVTWIQSISSYPIHVCFILILFSHLLLDLPNGVFPSGFPAKIPHAFSIAPMYATWPAHLSLLDVIFLIILGEEHTRYYSFSVFSSPLLRYPALFEMQKVRSHVCIS